MQLFHQSITRNAAVRRAVCLAGVMDRTQDPCAAMYLNVVINSRCSAERTTRLFAFELRHRGYAALDRCDEAKLFPRRVRRMVLFTALLQIAGEAVAPS